MTSLRRLAGVVALILFLGPVAAQDMKYEYATDTKDTLFHNVRVYGGLVHQHQDFFNKAFSFQGIEAGVIINHSLLAGAFGSLFVSNLDARTAVYPHLFVNIKQAGLFVGCVNHERRVFHTGWLLNMGYFTLDADEINFAVFDTQQVPIRTNGLVLSPQVFGEINITTWMKFRTGLSYNFYSFEEHPVIKRSDLNTIALTFGFIFGKFN
jgi:hypothetical protein